MEDTRKEEYIDLRVIWSRIWQHRKRFYIGLPLTFVVACAYVLCLPRYYTTEVKVVPEIGNSEQGGTLGDLASTFGIDLSGGQSGDAISPLLYADLMEDNAFIASLYDIRVKSAPGAEPVIDTTYYAYIKSFQQKTPWAPIGKFVRSLFKKKEKFSGSGDGMYDPYYISMDENGLMEKIRNDIGISVDKKTAVITISVKTQDALICRTVANAIKDRLQDFITDYRTSKARVNYDYYTALADSAYIEYQAAVKAYADLVDSDVDPILQSAKMKQSDLENEMQLKFNAYNTMKAQAQVAQAKVQERTPAFTLLKGASVPIKPAGPKRMIIVIALCFLSFLCISAHCLKDDIKRQLNKPVQH